MMWESLPAHVIVLIAGYIQDTETRRSASSTCRRWREIIFHNSILVLKKRHAVEMICRAPGSSCTVTDMEDEILVKFMSRIDTLVLRWCVCKTADFLNVLSKLLTFDKISVKQIHLNGNLSLDCISSDGTKLLKSDLLERKVEIISLLLKCCTRLTVVDFGFEPDLSRNAVIMKEVLEKVNPGKLDSLNIAAVQPSKIIRNKMFESIDHLNKLTILCLNFDKHFKDLINVLVVESNSETRLKQLIVVVSASFECSGVTEEMWENVMKAQEDLTLKLVIVEDYRCTYPAKIFQQISNLPKNLHVYSLVFVSNMSNEFHLASNSNLFTILHHSCHHIEEVSFHYVEAECPETELSTIADYFIEPLITCKKLQKLHLCGLFLEDADLLRLGIAFGKRLSDFVVYEKDVLVKSDVTGYLLPLVKSQVNMIEKQMKKILHRDWQLVKTPHRNRSVRGKVQRQLENVLHEVCSVTH